MIIKHYSETEVKNVEDADVSGVTMRFLISPEDAAPNFTMRLFHVEHGGYTFHHAHEWHRY